MAGWVHEQTCDAKHKALEGKMKEVDDDIQRLYGIKSAIGKQVIAILTGIIMLMAGMIINFLKDGIQ